MNHASHLKSLRLRSHDRLVGVAMNRNSRDRTAWSRGTTATSLQTRICHKRSGRCRWHLSLLHKHRESQGGQRTGEPTPLGSAASFCKSLSGALDSMSLSTDYGLLGCVSYYPDTMHSAVVLVLCSSIGLAENSLAASMANCSPWSGAMYRLHTRRIS